MEENRESCICLRSSDYKEANEQFKFEATLDFGVDQCNERMQKIKDLAIDPSNFVITIVHEFGTTTDAEKMVTKLTELKEMMGPQLGPAAHAIETIKANGQKVIAAVRIPPEGQAALAILDMVNSSFGDFSKKHQFLKFCIANGNSLDEILNGTSEGSPLVKFLKASLLKITLSVQKALPIKIAEFISNMCPPSEKEKVLMAGHFASAFHHFKFEVELAEPTGEAKNSFKEEMSGMIAGVAQMAIGMAQQFGLLEAVKAGGAKTTAMLCLTPFLSLQFDINAPTAISALEKASGMA